MPEAAAPGAAPAPRALVRGEALPELPEGLYIPPDALEVLLESFAGPLDLLLFLIRRQNLDLRDLPVAQIAEQYVQYISLMERLRLDRAGDYLAMAALLTEMKSRLLLPQPAAEEDEADPSAELARRLLEYERWKNAAAGLDALPRMERDVFAAGCAVDGLSVPRPLPKVTLPDLLLALQGMLLRQKFNALHEIETEPLSVQDRMAEILDRVAAAERREFTGLFRAEEGRLGVAVTLLAVLELLKLDLIECEQAALGAPIYVRRRARPETPEAGHA